MSVQPGAMPGAAAPFSIRSILAPLTAIVLGTFMAILDNTVVNVALPTLERVFKTDLQLMEWVITAYMLAQAAVIPLAGWLSDRYGSKQVYVTSLTLFTLGSILCALAPSGPMLIAFRVLQGLGGGMLMPIGMSFLYRLAPPERRGAVMGAFGIPILMAPALGPIISGWLVQYADWRYIFLINVPVGALAVFLALRWLPAMTAQRAAGSLDIVGAILGPIGFASVSYGISDSINGGWTGAGTLVGVGVGVGALILFAVRELSTEHPLLELRVFRSRDFSLAIVTQWVGQASLFGAMFLIPLFLQQVRGYGSFDAGLYTLPQALAAAAFMPIGGRLFDRIGARPLVIGGLTLVAVSTWFMAQVTGTTTGEELRWPLAMRGAGMGLMMMPLNTHLLNSAPRHLVSRVTALTGALQNVVGSLAIATLATILQRQATGPVATAQAAIKRHTSDTIAKLAGGAPAGAPAGGHPALPPAVLADLKGYAATHIHNAMAIAFGNTFMVAMAVALVGVVLAFTLRRNPVVAQESAGAPAAAKPEGAFEAALG